MDKNTFTSAKEMRLEIIALGTEMSKCIEGRQDSFVLFVSSLPQPWTGQRGER